MPCEFCGSTQGCDCVERLHCTQAGEFGHMLCGRCEHNPDLPKFLCQLCATKAMQVYPPPLDGEV